MGVIAKYKFNNTLEANLLPEFNSEFTSDLYTVTDEVNGEVTTRTIESDSSPTLMRFGSNLDTYVEGSELALLEVLDMNTSGLATCNRMFRRCSNLISIECDWDTSNVTSMWDMFTNCTQLTSLDVSSFNTSKVTSMEAMFYNCNQLTSLDLSNFNTSKVTSMAGMFNDCNKLTSLDVSNFDTLNVTRMNYMFYSCSSLILLDLSNFNTANVTNMGGMFQRCSNLTKLDLSNFDTTNVTAMYDMFANCSKLTSLNLSGFNTINVTDMNGMFYHCSNLTSLDVSDFNTSSVAGMQYMFQNCSNLTSLDLSNFDTAKVATMDSMFRSCNNLTTLNISNFNTSKVTSMTYMFRGCNNLTSLDLSGFDTSNVTNIGAMFYDCNNLTSLDLSGFDTSKVTSMNAIFYNCNKLTTLDISNFDTSKVTDSTNMLTSTSSLKYIKCNNVSTLNTLNTLLPTKTSDNPGTIICKSDTTNLDTATLSSKYWNITDELTLVAKYVFDKSIHNNCIPEFNTEFEGYFIEDEVVEGNNEVTRTIESCGMLPTLMRFGMEGNNNPITNSLLKILDMNTSQITNMHYMFRACINLISIKCDWNTSKVTTMNNMFCNCNKLIYLDTFNWDTSKVTDMNGIFFGCNVLEKIDISNWDTSKVTRLNYAFANQAKTINLSNCNCEKVTDFAYAFAYNKKIISLNISGLNIPNTSAITDMFVTTPNLKNIIMLNCNLSTIQKVASLLPTTHTQTIWHNLSKADEELYQAVKGVELKRHEENKVEVKLNSPLLEGDTIEVKDGRLCHVHKMSSIILDKNYKGYIGLSGTLSNTIRFYVTVNTPKEDTHIISNNFLSNIGYNTDYKHGYTSASEVYLFIKKDNLPTPDVDGFKQWLSNNLTTVIYELATPYYEDITNLQSAPTLKTYLECSMEIDTDLPIDTNVTYRTNLSSVYVMERELDELDNGTDLGDILEGEVNE